MGLLIRFTVGQEWAVNTAPVTRVEVHVAGLANEADGPVNMAHAAGDPSPPTAQEVTQ